MIHHNYPSVLLTEIRNYATQLAAHKTPPTEVKSKTQQIISQTDLKTFLTLIMSMSKALLYVLEEAAEKKK